MKSFKFEIFILNTAANHFKIYSKVCILSSDNIKVTDDNYDKNTIDDGTINEFIIIPKNLAILVSDFNIISFS